MPPRKRGVRKFFSKPKKGFRTSGKQKCWRGMEPPQQLPDESTRDDNMFEGFCDDDLDTQHDLEQVAVTSKPKLRAVGLFEGIGTGFHILTRELGLDVEKYYSSEIDKDAIRVQLHNFGDEIIHLGDVRKLDQTVLEDMGEIHLLIGGSPCADFSLVNCRRRNFDPTGSGILFYEFVRIRDYFLERSRKRGDGKPFFWLFENTNKMEKESLKIFNRELGCKPIQLCSSQFTPMKRMRNFWGNLFDMETSVNNLAPGDVPLLCDILPKYKTINCDILPTLTGNKAAQRCGKKRPVVFDGKEEYLCASDYERIFGFPHGYTDCGLSECARVKLIGRSWSVHTVRAILQPLKELFRVVKC